MPEVIIACQRVARTCSERIWRSTRRATHWRVYSSNIVSILSVLPLSGEMAAIRVEMFQAKLFAYRL
jgi:hypothetical protein